MKLLSVLTVLLFFSVSSNNFAQSIQGQKSLAIKHARVSIQILEDKTMESGSGIKVPNPGWNPTEWTFAETKVIYKDSKIDNQTNINKNRISSPTPDTSFAGLMDNGNSIPPDVNGAVGPNHLMQTLNTGVRISDREGNELFSTSLSAWWGPMPGNGGTFDPKIVYDPYSNRWIMITPSGGNSLTTRMYIGVSTTSNPLDDWNFYWIPTDPESILWFDYPNLGFNKNWITIGGIMRNSAFEAVDFVVFAMDKMAAYNGEEEATVSRFTTTIGSAIVPAFTYDPLVEEMYLISTGNGNDNGFGYVNLFKLSGAVMDPVFELKGSIGIQEPWENWSYENHGDFLPQLGSSEKLNSVDARMHTMIFRNDKLWAVHHIYLPADDPQYTAIQWWNLDTTGVILERGRIEDENQEISFAFPSIAVNANEDVFVGHGVFSPNEYASAAYSYKDHLDDAGSMRDYYVYKQGLAPYYKTFGGDRNRWGDYSAVCVDPVHDVDFWALHEYAELPTGNDTWGTWWALVMPTFDPIADFSSDEILIPVGETVNFTDLTLGIPSSWNWTFEGGTPNTSSEQNPQDILFDQEGSFNIKLIASNDLGTDTITKESFITTSADILPEVYFSVDKEVVCIGNEVVFTDQTLYSPIQWEWQFDPSNVTFVNATDENSQNPEVIFNEALAYSVSLKAWNLNGSSEITKFGLINAGGYAPYFIETFEDDSFKAHEWLIENPDDEITWELLNVAGNSPGDKAMGVDFSTYLIGKRDRLITPPFNLTGMESAILEFEHAYAKKHEPLTDSLIVYVSSDCGLNWTRVFEAGEDGSGNFATHELTDNFWPQVQNDWCGNGWGSSCSHIDISNWLMYSDVVLAFETYSAIGNPLFIDNISIEQGVGIDVLEENIYEMQVFPNPTKGAFTIILPDSDNFKELSLVNYMGQVLVNTNLEDNNKQIEIQRQPNWRAGTYFLIVRGQQKVLSTKLIIH